jgi:hypothetical protein
MDASNNSYDRTSDGLYCNTETKMLYSSDSTYWNTTEDEDMDAEDEAVDSVEDDRAGEVEGGDEGDGGDEGEGGAEE